MHPEALEWVSRYASDAELAVLDIGGRNINGSPRAMFPNADYTTLDISPGEGVDIVADAATWTPDRRYDLVIACEVFEHTDAWPQICATAHKACRKGGRFITTMAGPGRVPHSAVDGGSTLYLGEHYANVDPVDLTRILEGSGWREIGVDQQGSDVRSTARK